MTKLQFIRLIALLMLGICSYIYIDGLTSGIFISLFVFYFGVWFLQSPLKSDVKFDLDKEFEKHKPHIFANYQWDDSEWYGVFFILANKKVFIDIKKDQYFERRKEHAAFLISNSNELDANLFNFQNKQLEYKDRRIYLIGLHATDLKQGEVIWWQSGHTILKELNFLLII